MNGIRKWICCLAAATVAAIVLPTYAAQSQNKTFSIDMSVPTQGLDTGSSTVQALIKNTSPAQSSSTLSSVDLFVDLGWTLDPNVQVTVFETADPSTKYIADTTSQSGHIIVQNLAPLKPVVKTGNSLVIAFSVTSGSCGDGTFNANVWSGSQIGTGNIFTQNGGQNLASVACQKLACDQGALTLTDVAPGQVTVIRDSFNKDGTSSGTTCDAVSYYASDTLNNNVGLPEYIVHFRWDNVTTTAATAAFQYDIFYETAPTHPQVGWLYLDGTTATNAGANPNANPANPVVFIDPPDCLSPKVLPAPYGSLNSPLSAPSTTVKISTSTGSFPSLPFPIVIGTERMQVIAFSSNGWTVASRPNGVSHPKNALVMSTPLPQLTGPITTTLADGITVIPPHDASNPASSPYQVGMQAQICKVMSRTTDTNVPFVEYIDIGDAWGLGK